MGVKQKTWSTAHLPQFPPTLPWPPAVLPHLLSSGTLPFVCLPHLLSDETSPSACLKLLPSAPTASSAHLPHILSLPREPPLTPTLSLSYNQAICWPHKPSFFLNQPFCSPHTPSICPHGILLHSNPFTILQPSSCLTLTLSFSRQARC